MNSAKPEATPRNAARRPGEVLMRLIEELRQRLHAPAHRLPDPEVPPAAEELPVPDQPPPVPPPSVHEAELLEAEMLADVATCVWYLKTRYFNRPWTSQDDSHEDPKTRRALGRLFKGIMALEAGGVRVTDPTGEYYPAGAEAFMRPIEFNPTAGLTTERVSETVLPIVYWKERVIQRGEVFVEVPQARPAPGDSGGTS